MSKRLHLKPLSSRVIDSHGEITQLRSALCEMTASRAHSFNLYSRAPIAYLVVSKEGTVLELNLEAARLLARTDIIGQKLNRCVIAEDQEIYINTWNQMFHTDFPQSCELRMFQGNTLFWAYLRMDLGEDDGHQVCRVVLLDITERKTLEARQLENSARLWQSAKETESKVKEMYHRVKNNLQLISSLLRMQVDLANDNQASSMLKDCHQRVLSMAMIHERLYKNEHLDEVDFGEFVSILVSELFSAYGRSTLLNCRLNLADIALSADHAVPCGLIVNELVTNSLKYAYPDGRPGEIHIDLNENPDGFVRLTVSDQGVGLPPDLDWRNSTSMGLPIVDGLARQMGGTLLLGPPPGASFTVEFQRSPRTSQPPQVEPRAQAVAS